MALDPNGPVRYDLPSFGPDILATPGKRHHIGASSRLNQEGSAMTQNSSPPGAPSSEGPEITTLFLDKEGRWFHEGIEVTHERTCLMFSQHLHVGPDGRYYVRAGDERALVEVEDTPYVVQSVTVNMVNNHNPESYTLHLNDKTEEFLDPYSLLVGQDNVMYCRVKDGHESARFLRPAYYQICGAIGGGEDETKYWIPWKGQRVPIHFHV